MMLYFLRLEGGSFTFGVDSNEQELRSTRYDFIYNYSTNVLTYSTNSFNTL